jgi:spermidine synthase
VGYFRVVLYGDVFVIGTLVGIELPLLMRLLKEDLGFDESVVRGLTFDYVGSLFASVLFPLVLVPWLGLVRTAALSGIVNALVAWAGARLLLPGKGRWARQVGSLAVAATLATVIVYGRTIAQLTAD